ncbi:hypothetical protein PACID_06160 [Acidipropionibacterium acidipropionici ATCC 4875]|uniref:Uncharacterized protein n=1 Tax=Acidipropionibacterium acidipropionici (strain ATCC 4875 / DSM 20272 / JCM 6432 / NBRC 12425 / NCIMB 8070 / 4) TaxID=1171373 RepID=K7RQ91_ACIA4|nr:hypothetical protein PACID_06160 [Acidipropionibacterium acidipropionici ATCC 4875]
MASLIAMIASFVVVFDEGRESGTSPENPRYHPHCIDAPCRGRCRFLDRRCRF